MVAPVMIMSSTMIGARSLTSPMMLRSDTSDPLMRALWITTTGRCRKVWYRSASFTAPRSGATITVKEPFDLWGVEVDRNEAREADGFSETRDDFCADGLAPRCPPILASVTEVRHDRRQAGCTGAAAGIGQKQQLHLVLVDRQTGRLNEVDVVAADAFFDVDVQLAVGETLQDSLARFHAKLLGDADCEGHVG